MKEVRFSEHSRIKLNLLSARGIFITPEFILETVQFPDKIEISEDNKRIAQKKFNDKGLPKNKLFILKNNNHSRSVGGRDRWLPPPSNFVVELILYIINQVFLFKNIWN